MLMPWRRYGKSWFFQKINKINKSFSKLIKVEVTKELRPQKEKSEMKTGLDTYEWNPEDCY